VLAYREESEGKNCTAAPSEALQAFATSKLSVLPPQGLEDAPRQAVTVLTT
jgi:hypothetical protein